MNCQKTFFLTFIILTTTFYPLMASKKAVDYNGNPISKIGVTLTSQTSSTIIANYTQAINFDGLLDNTFGSQGIVTTNFVGFDSANAVALQPDGKIIAVGNTNTGGAGDFALARYNTNGSLDVTFGTNGKVTTSLSAGRDIAYGVALQSDGKIVVVGGTDITVAGDFVIARYNYNGSLDTTFNSAGTIPGVVILNLTGGIDTAYGVLIQPNGAIVAVGGTNTGAAGDFVLVRYTTTGIPDTTFNGTGQIIKSLSGGVDIAYSVLLQSDGKIISVGISGTSIGMVRYTSTGVLDTSFNGTGIQTTGMGNAFASALQSDGSILATGTDAGQANLQLARYTSTGTLDTSFNLTGVVTNTNAETANCIILQANKILVGGNTAGAVTFLARYNPNGSIDTSFGTAGQITTPATHRTYGIILQPDEKIVAVGNEGANFTVSRYINPFTLASFTESYGSVGLI
jgi:uncharacterized delta-60 repeat protein